MFMRKLKVVFAILAVMAIIGGGYGNVRGQGGEAAAPSLGLAAEPTDPYFIAIDINHIVYALTASSQTQERVRVGPGDSAAVADFFNKDGFCEVVAITTTQVTTTSAIVNVSLYEPVFNSHFERSFNLVSRDAYPLDNFFVSSKWGDSAVGDFDGDGALDVAFSGKGCTGSTCAPDANKLVQVLLNKPGGWQRVPVSVTSLSGRGYEQIAGLDDGHFNGDSIWDLGAQQYWEGSNNFTHLLMGQSSASVLVDTSVFTNTVANATGGTSSLVAGDFNEDGHDDLIIGQDDDGDPGQAWLYTGNGTGGFTYAGEAYDTNPTVEVGSDQHGAGFADAYDFNGDGHLDIVAPAERIGILLFLGDGTGHFNPVPVVINAETMDWFKVAAPPVSAAPCLWNESYTVRLPIITR